MFSDTQQPGWIVYSDAKSTPSDPVFWATLLTTLSFFYVSAAWCCLPTILHCPTPPPHLYAPWILGILPSHYSLLPLSPPSSSTASPFLWPLRQFLAPLQDPLPLAVRVLVSSSCDRCSAGPWLWAVGKPQMLQLVMHQREAHMQMLGVCKPAQGSRTLGQPGDSMVWKAAPAPLFWVITVPQRLWSFSLAS